MVVLYYILKLSVGLMVVWLFYQLVLRRLTFYTWNRWYLVICPALAALLPLIDIAPVLEKNNWNKVPVVSAIPQIPSYVAQSKPFFVNKTFSEQLLDWFPLLIVTGAAVMLTRLLVQYFSLRAMRRSATLLLNGRVKVYQVNKPVIPFSFGNSIFLNQHLHGEEELKEIIRHEFIHVKQRHTFDIIWSEAICILTWYNPFSWLLRKATRQNLEFIADQQVLKTGLDRREYQYLLLKVIGVPSFSIASNFNFKSLKKRIAMMNKVKSAKVHLVRFMLLLPVVAILLVAFRNAAKHRQQPPVEKAAADTVVPGRKGLPENVRSFHSVNNRVTVTLKDGKEEEYDMNSSKDRAAFEKKYGKMPVAPTPPEPPAITEVALAPPVMVRDEVPPSPVAPVPPVEAPVPPYPVITRQDDCYNEKGYCLSVINSPKGQLVLVVSKGKKEVELVYLDDWKKDKKYEDKFGKLPAPPPPPPPPPPAPMHPPVREHDMPDGVSTAHVRDFDVVYKSVPEVHKVLFDSARHIPAPVRPIAHVINPEKDEILAVITKNTTFKELEQLKTDLLSKGITLTWINMKAADGKLSMLEGKLNAGTDNCHFHVDDFKTLTLTRKKGDGARKPFGVHSYSEKVTD